MWNDMAQLTRMSVSARALERYQPRWAGGVAWFWRLTPAGNRKEPAYQR